MVLDEVEVAKPDITTLEATEHYGKFSIEPLERGYGITLGNALRRMLLSALEGAAITWIKIEGVLHEYSTISHMKEDVLVFMLNVKTIRLRPMTDRPGKLRLEVQGEREVTAGDILTSADFEIVNPDLSLATLDSADAKLSVEFNVEHGKGYLAAQHDDGLPIGVLPVDAVFSPVRKVSYTVEQMRVGQATDYERLLIEVWTDATTTPVEAVRRAAQVLVDHFFLFSNAGRIQEPGGEKSTLALSIPAEQYTMPVERLELTSRTLNCLKRANIHKVGEVLEKSSQELLNIRNFGEKSLEELYGRLREMNLLPLEGAEEEQEEGVSPDGTGEAAEEEMLADQPSAGAEEEQQPL